MRIEELLDLERIALNFEAKDKKHALQQLAKLCSAVCPGTSPKTLLSALMKRENLGSTGIGGGIAIPHARIDKISAPVGLLAVSKKGNDFSALDGEPVHLFFVIVYPQASVGEHLKALSKIARLMRDAFIRDSILQAESPEQVMRILVAEEAREKELCLKK